jgi:DNA-binding transcriptional MerR regulator
MRSSELAALAAVSVRTLRHYHQVGVLPEAKRGANGYRDYSVLDLVRLLRIKRLASIGIPLERMSEVLDSDSSQAALLDELEAAVDDEISRLSAQKALIAVIRAGEADPDVPPTLAPFVKLLSADPGAPSRSDREHSVLLAHLAGETGMQKLVEVYGRMADPAVRDLAIEATRRFEALTEESDGTALDDLVEAFLAWFAPLAAELGPTLDEALRGTPSAERLLLSYNQGTLNRVQREVLSRISERIRDDE